MVSDGNHIYKVTPTGITSITSLWVTANAYTPSLKYVIANSNVYYYNADTNSFTAYLSSFSASQNYKIYENGN